MVCITFVFCAATAIASRAQSFTTLVNFDQTDGADSVASLIQGTDGDFYGTTKFGGANNTCYQGCGTVFKMTPQGTLTTLHSFDGTDGAYPDAGLVQASDGNFYGTTSFGGTNLDCVFFPVLGDIGCGTVFKITPEGTLTTLHSFCAQTYCTDGGLPFAGLVQGTDGNLYGTTEAGGIINCPPSVPCGTVFKITPEGTLTTLYSFCFQSNCADGNAPYGTLVQASDGNFYGTTQYGGNNFNGYYSGTIFKITAGGTLTTLYSFCFQSNCADGAFPAAGLVQANDGNFYGTTSSGGSNGGYGTVFKITPGAMLTTLYSFGGVHGYGGTPVDALVQATDGNFYGTTVYGGAHYYYGMIFRITPSGHLTTMHSFDITDGSFPDAGLLQATNGNFYGTTSNAGANGNCPSGCGTVFSLSNGLGPFVTTAPTSGNAGTQVIILGTNLTGTTGVTFNGCPASFDVVSATEITTTVPTCASTGPVQVTTPGGVLSSNVPFRVAPSILNFLPRIGRVGTSVVITGEALTGATGVTFGGVHARNFTVESNTEIRATVPVGARTGKIGVTTPGGMATSTETFRVI